MDEKTHQYYSSHVKESAELYKTCSNGGVSKYFPSAFTPGSRVLDIGSGSGRDLALLISAGYDACGIDASAEMVSYTIAQIPSLTGRVKAALLPFDGLFFDTPFDAILCSALLMHIPDEQMFDAAFTLRANLRPGGRLLVSVPIARDDVGPDHRTPDGRLFIMRQPGYYRLLLERIGFRQIAYSEDDDSLGRKGIRWAIMIFTLEQSGGSRPIDRIESILNRDKKTATYKLALFRALCDIALTGYNQAVWYPDGTVGIDVKTVAEKWIVYYWPLIESPLFIPQLNGEKESASKSILFRTPMKDLVRSYSSQGGFNRFYMDMADGSFLQNNGELYAEVMNIITSAILKGPVVYAGGSLDDGAIFTYDAGDKRIKFSGDIWRELSLMGHWIKDALILRWAELTSSISGNEIPASQVIDLLLRLPVTERDTQESRKIFTGSSSLECVWTGVSLKKSFDLDHVIPFSLWHNNDLWNLLPAHPKVNNQKRDKLPARELLNSRRDVIIDYWRIIRDAFPVRFDNECRRITGISLGDNWQMPLFSTVSEAVEVTAFQRGIERWGG